MILDLANLQELALDTLQFNYNVDAPDTLSLSVTPEVYDEQLTLPEADRMLPVSPGERLTVSEGGEVVFSGTLPTGVQFEYEAGSVAMVNIELQSDYNLLDRIVFSKLDSNGEALFPGSLTPTRTTTLNAVVNTIDNWVGGYIPSALACDVSGKVPTPQSDGTDSCASLLNEAMRWVPDTVMVQRYGVSNTLRVTTPDKLGSLALDPNQHGMQSLSVQERDDLRVPVAALVGGAKGKWPSGVDIRTPGAFVYAVPVDKDAPEAAAQRGGAGSSPASSKMVVRGVQLPEAKTYERSVDEYNTDPYSADSQVQKFIKRFFPELAPLQQVACAGSCFINVMSESDFLEELKEDDENAQLPNNYQEASALWGNSVYVLTEGSFPASPHNRKNVKGLRWCKAQLSLVVSVKSKDINDENYKISAEVRKICQEFLPGRRVTKSGNSFYYVRKTLSCILINRRKRVYDPATARLCSDDPGYNEEEPDEPSDEPAAADYAAAMEQYQRAASVPQYEGSVSLLHDGTIRPWELTGKQLSILGMRPEWNACEPSFGRSAGTTSSGNSAFRSAPGRSWAFQSCLNGDLWGATSGATPPCVRQLRTTLPTPKLSRQPKRPCRSLRALAPESTRQAPGGFISAVRCTSATKIKWLCVQVVQFVMAMNYSILTTPMSKSLQARRTARNGNGARV